MLCAICPHNNAPTSAFVSGSYPAVRAKDASNEPLGIGNPRRWIDVLTMAIPITPVLENSIQRLKVTDIPLTLKTCAVFRHANTRALRKDGGAMGHMRVLA